MLIRKSPYRFGQAARVLFAPFFGPLTRTRRPFYEAVTPPLTEEEHRALARRHGGTPITYREASGKERPAIRLDNGEILIDYRSELRALTQSLSSSLHPS